MCISNSEYCMKVPSFHTAQIALDPFKETILFIASHLAMILVQSRKLVQGFFNNYRLRLLQMFWHFINTSSQTELLQRVFFCSINKNLLFQMGRISVQTHKYFLIAKSQVLLDCQYLDVEKFFHFTTNYF